MSAFRRTTLLLLSLLSGTYGIAAAQTVTNSVDLVAAVLAANSDTTNKNHLINLADGPYTLSSTLLITSKITISGNATIDASGLSIGIEIVAPGNVALNGVTITNSVGNCITNSGGTLTLNGATVTKCVSAIPLGGAGIFNDGAGGSVTLNSSTVSQNSFNVPVPPPCDPGPCQVGGAGIFNASTLVVNSSLIQGNKADIGAGIFSTGSATVNGSSLVGNCATTAGSGIYNLGGILSLNKSSLADDISLSQSDLYSFGSASVLTIDKFTVIAGPTIILP